MSATRRSSFWGERSSRRRGPVRISGFLAIVVLVGFLSSPSAQTVWTKVPDNPVLGPGEPGEWDSGGVANPCVLFSEGIFKMWYTGLAARMEFAGEIGYAVSTTGREWLKHGGNPVLRKGKGDRWDAMGLWTPEVLFDEEQGLYRMWYAGVGGLGTSFIGYATSTDGVSWSEYEGNPVLIPGEMGVAWDWMGVFSPSVLKEEDGFRMWYIGVQPVSWHVGLAFSEDGVHWSKFEGNPVFEIEGTAEWRTLGVSFECVRRKDGTYAMWYTGVGEDMQQIGRAFSKDGVHWIAEPAEPILFPGPSGAWDERDVASPSVLLRETEDLMWYQARDVEDVSRIGLATASHTVTAVEDASEERTPEAFHLSQNYPNPFNPQTTITFDVAKPGTVHLSVRALNGQHIRTLVDGERAVGSYSVTWDGADDTGRGVASGVYLCRMEAGDYRAVRKLILAR